MKDEGRLSFGDGFHSRGLIWVCGLRFNLRPLFVRCSSVLSSRAELDWLGSCPPRICIKLRRRVGRD